MHFEENGMYHIYNQGNNRIKIFPEKGNYVFFMQKIRTHMLPFADILAWCLMPNHFHLMAFVNKVELPKDILVPNPKPVLMQKKEPDIPSMTLNSSIGIMLASYTRAINKRNDWSGSVFRSETKSICLNEVNGHPSDWYLEYGVTVMNIQIPDHQYPQTCFNYIHNNPVRARLVSKPEDWEFSSYPDFKGLRNGTLVNTGKAFSLGLHI
jgi:putative transposase